jgi:hypothetical protein
MTRADITRTTLGKDLVIGDVLSVWFEPYKVTISELTPYEGTLKHLWAPDTARTARFKETMLKMTVEPDMNFEVYSKS